MLISAMALALEKENSLPNLLTAAAMYFTYCQAWVYICAKAHYLDVVKHEKLEWDKTVRSPRPT